MAARNQRHPRCHLVPCPLQQCTVTGDKDAATIAGLDAFLFASESTSAATVHDLNNRDIRKEGNILVFDLSGETLHVTIVNIGDGVVEVKATAGDTYLGGRASIPLW